MQRIESEFGQIYDDPDAQRRYVPVVGRIAAMLVVAVVAAGATVAGVAAADRSASREAASARSTSDLLSFTALLALTPDDVWADLIDAQGLAGILVDEDGSVGLLDGAPGEPRWEAWWQEDVPLAAQRSSRRTFTVLDPDGAPWELARVQRGLDETLVLGRPTPPSPVAFGRTFWVIAGTSLALVALVAAVAAWFGSRTVRPVLALHEAAEDLRVRGSIRDEVRERLERRPRAPIEVGQLGTNLLAIESDAHHSRLEADALLAAASALSRSLDVDAVLDAALMQLQDLLGVDRSALLTYDPHEDRFHVVTTHGHDEHWRVEASGSPGSSMPTARRALRERAPQQIADTEAEVVPSSIRVRARHHGYRSLLAVPLLAELERPVVLVLHGNDPRGFSWDEIELSRSFGSIAGAALRNAELFARTDERLRAESSRLTSIVESVEDGILVAGADDRVVYANAALRRLLPPQVAVELRVSIGELIDGLLAEGGSSATDHEALAALGPDDGWVDVDLGSTNGSGTWRVRAFDVRDRSGLSIGRGQTWTDISRERELDKMKSGLLAAVSHEFRTPLALIKGYATTLLADDVIWTRDEQVGFLRLVSHEADRLTELVQRILDMGRIDAGMVALQVLPVELAAIVDATLDAVPTHRDRIVVSDVPSVVVDVDAARVVTVLRNLLENACTYSPPEEEVNLDLGVEDGSLVISVRDRGPGIDTALRTRIFDTFVRGDVGLASEHGGVGLGLALSKGFVEAHGGTIEVADPEGAPGSVFRCSIPCDPHPIRRRTP